MLTADLHALADKLASGEITGEAAATAVRELARFTPDQAARKWNAVSEILFAADETWSWHLDGYRSGGVTHWQLTSNRFTGHRSNMDSVIDFTWWEPAAVDQLGRALCEVSARRAAALAAEDEEGYED